jgi:putative DNA methylase
MDAIRNGLSDDGVTLSEGGRGARAYADAVVIYLACVIDRMAYYGSTLTTWLPKDNALRDCMPRQALAMSWDYAEANPLGKSSGDILTCAKAVASYLSVASTAVPGIALQADAQMMTGELCIYSTDPPYFDNIGYADLSDYFYVWLRRTLGPVLPELFSTIAVPKAEELVASPYRHGGAQLAERFFLDGMTRAMRVLYAQAHPAFPITIYYAFKQSESDENDGTVSTGWETFLEAVIGAGLSVTGTWPLRTEGAGRLIAKGANALASSIVLVCRKRPLDAPIATRREFAKVLRSELPAALGHLQRGNIAPVDIAQASIGPGMAVYSRYSKVVDAAGARLTVRDALAMINQSLDEILAEQEGDFDADSRWALAWFEQYGFGEGDFGVAETLSKAKNTSVNGLVDAGVLASKRGKVRLLSPGELPDDWDPASDERLTTWEMVHHLVRVLEANSEPGAAALAAKLGSNAEVARELCYRLYTICERKKRAAEALSYNSLVQSWPEIMRLARESPAVTAGAVPAPPEAPQTTLFEDGAKPKKKRTKGKN